MPAWPPKGRGAITLAGLSPSATLWLTALLVVVVPGLVSAHPLAAAPNCPVFPADNGSPWFISSAPNRGWNNDALHLLDRLTGRGFEVVNTSSLAHPGLKSTRYQGEELGSRY